MDSAKGAGKQSGYIGQQQNSTERNKTGDRGRKQGRAGQRQAIENWRDSSAAKVGVSASDSRSREKLAR